MYFGMYFVFNLYPKIRKYLETCLEQSQLSTMDLFCGNTLLSLTTPHLNDVIFRDEGWHYLFVYEGLTVNI